jgi:glutamine synthetase type III
LKATVTAKNGFRKQPKEVFPTSKPHLMHLAAYISEKTRKLFTEMTFSAQRELDARWEIRHENYAKVIQIESRVLGDLAGNHIIPTAIRYQNVLIENVKGLKEIFRQNSLKNRLKCRSGLLRKFLSM